MLPKSHFLWVIQRPLKTSSWAESITELGYMCSMLYGATLW
jgi:hypothetical protein